ncbi:hypothetical protein V6N11_063158 [Hibiscus sabdariffa]|uniref:Uncharacterized protein n=2 Tax=Hibiscus sabdariffa TaxID=183260 RepID=A0ABR2CQQ5_9ROSI
MGDHADGFFELVFGSDDTFGSRWCESRSQLPLGRRTVRLDRPLLGLRFPSRLLCQVWNDVRSASGNFWCGKGTCLFYVLQDHVRVVIPVDWYDGSENRDWVNSGIGLCFEWSLGTGSRRLWLGVERWFWLSVCDYADGVIWSRIVVVR